MRKQLIVRSFIVMGAFGAGLLGCPVWSEDGSAGTGPVVIVDGGTADTPPVILDSGPQACTTNSQCPGGYCDATRHCATSQSCTNTAGCPAGQYCETSRNVCVAGCSTTADCTRLGSSIVCNTATRQCVPSGQCASNTDCAATPATPVCVGGSCTATSNVCQFDYQCTGSGQHCVDGRCIVGCTTANAATVCASGQVCTNNFCVYPTSSTTSDCGGRCISGQLCVSGVCMTTCSTDTQCGSGNFCDSGVCRVDTRPHPFCTLDSQCNSGSVCYNGACRRLCPMPGTGTDGRCMTVDVQFDLCRTDTMGRSLCTSTSEVTPQCARTADCTAGRACVNARCQ